MVLIVAANLGNVESIFLLEKLDKIKILKRLLVGSLA